ncbi:phage major capsid protein [Micromonospora purpureochromogenes]|uniref:phage major capsid protein n=1 Tax=Micromonospora purpureochromogenes TaxID=47872 RepID=UPI00340E8467
MAKTDNPFIVAANAALDKRSALLAELRTLTDNPTRAAEINAQIDALGAEAEQNIRQAEREVEHRELNARAATLAGGRGTRGEWRSVVPNEREWRALIAEGTPSAGGYAVPATVAKEWVGKLRAQSTFMRAPGLNVVRFDQGNKFTIPQLSASTDPAVVGEGNAIPEGSLTFAGLALDPVKYAALYRASNEMIDDASIDVEDLVGQTLIRDIANVVDRDAFQGAGGVNALSGLTAAGNSTATTLAAGKTVVSWDDVIDAYGSIAAIGGTPSVVWASVDMWKGLVKARENGTNGGYLAGSVTNDPARAAMGLPLLPTMNLPARTVIVADASRVFVGVRKDVRLAKSDAWKFDSDSMGYRATFRIAGVRVAEAASVQRIVAAAA